LEENGVVFGSEESSFFEMLEGIAEVVGLVEEDGKVVPAFEMIFFDILNHVAECT